MNQQLFLQTFMGNATGNMQEENRLMTLVNGHLIERIRLLKEKISLAHGNAMQHMFYRALADSSGSIINECHPQYVNGFSHDNEQPQTIPGPKKSNTLNFRAIRPNYWREAGSIENIEGIPVPDPIQGLEQLRDYIQFGLEANQSRYCLNRKSGVQGLERCSWK